MCYLITVAIPDGLGPRFREELGRGVSIGPHNNPSIKRHLPAGFECFSVSDGHCSCGLYVSTRESPVENPGHVDRLVKKYRKLGWSEAKVERAVASARRAQELQTAKEFVGLQPDVAGALSRFSTKVGKLLVLVHFYSGYYEKERFAIKKSTLSQKSLDDCKVPFPEDTLMEIGL